MSHFVFSDEIILAQAPEPFELPLFYIINRNLIPEQIEEKLDNRIQGGRKDKIWLWYEMRNSERKLYAPNISYVARFSDYEEMETFVLKRLPPELPDESLDLLSLLFSKDPSKQTKPFSNYPKTEYHLPVHEQWQSSPKRLFEERINIGSWHGHFPFVGSIKRLGILDENGGLVSKTLPLMTPQLDESDGLTSRAVNRTRFIIQETLLRRSTGDFFKQREQNHYQPLKL